NVHDFTSQVPVGTVCTVTETGRGGATETRVRVNEGTPQVFAADTPASVALTLRDDIAIAVRFTNFVPSVSPEVPQQVPPGPIGSLPLTGDGGGWEWPVALGSLALGAGLLVAAREVRHRTSLGGRIRIR